MACWKPGSPRGRWHGTDRAPPWQAAEKWWRGGPRSSGNAAFDEYRMATLRRLEEEEREFRGFLDQLRMAKDKAEFDEFLAERRRRAAEGPGPEAPPAQS